MVRRALIVGVSAMLAGCMVGPNYKRPPVKAPPQFRGGEPHPTQASLAKSRNDPARPPSWRRASNSVMLNWPSANATDAAKPANPPPTMATRGAPERSDDVRSTASCSAPFMTIRFPTSMRRMAVSVAPAVRRQRCVLFPTG